MNSCQRALIQSAQKTTEVPTRTISDGFTITELMIAVAIVGILSAIALPNYFNQVQRTRQSEAAAALAQLQTTLVAYVDENITTDSGCDTDSSSPTWQDLNEISAVMTASGPANTCTSLTAAISMPNGRYTLNRTGDTTDSDYYEFTATDSSAVNFNVMACVDLSNGASDLEKGNASAAVQTTDLDC